MESSELIFAYRSDAGGLKLLGILSIVLCPLVMWMTFQDANNDEALIAGVFVRGPVVPWIMRLFSLVLLWAGIAMVKGAADMTKKRSTIELSNESMRIFGQKTLMFSSITKLEPGNDRLTLTTKDNEYVVLASRMESKEKFDELSAQLAARIAR